MIASSVAPFFAFAGLVIYGFASGKAQTVGIVTYGAGLLVTLFEIAPRVLHLP